MTALPSLAAIALSTAIILCLWYGDPKRRRVAGLPAAGGNARTRRFLAVGAAMPGLALAALGDSAAFLVWLGGCAMAGWLIAQIGNRTDRA